MIVFYFNSFSQGFTSQELFPYFITNDTIGVIIGNSAKFIKHLDFKHNMDTLVLNVKIGYLSRKKIYNRVPLSSNIIAVRLNNVKYIKKFNFQTSKWYFEKYDLFIKPK